MLQLKQSVRSSQSAQNLCRTLFGLHVTVAELPSYADVNFAITERATGKRYVLKLANPDVDTDKLALENAAMQQLAAAQLPIATPEPATATTGNNVIPFQDTGGRIWHARLVTFIEGRLWSEALPASAEQLQELGRALGAIDNALAQLEHPQLQQDNAWDIRHAPAAREQLALIKDDALRGAVQNILDRFDGETRSRLDALPRALIYNDANDNNLLVDDQGRLAGIVDFGDMVHTWRIAELAIAAAYVCQGWDDPINGMGHLVAGYHDTCPLQESEIAVLGDLILMRLVQSLGNSAEAKRREPENHYISISEQPLQTLLWQLLDVAPQWLHYQLRAACGWPAVPQSSAVHAWLREQQASFASVLKHDLRHCRKRVYDFTDAVASGISLEGDQREQTRRMFDELSALDAPVGVGRYRENRRCYQGDQFAVHGEARSVHLGIDLFAPTGEPIFAPLAGTIHSFADNALPFDYGPAIILRHEPEPGICFYTLYGHLGRESLTGLSVGQYIPAGERIATIGDIDVNGGWIPHLHFQITLDMLGKQGDFPGVGESSKLAAWESLCPDPNLILGMPESVKARTPWSARAIRGKRQHHMSAAQSTSYAQPLKIVAGDGGYLIDDQGRHYLDMVNNVCHVGHCHPRVVQTAQQQMAQLNTNSRYLHDNLVDYSERLTDQLPAHLSVVFHVNSGSEANDLALRLARAHTGRYDIGIIDHAYHGHLSSLIDISPYKHDGPGGRGTPAFVHKCPFPDPYRGPIKAGDPQCGARYAEQAKTVLGQEHKRDGGTGLAAFIAESFSGVGGQVIWPPGYLSAVFEHVRALGGVAIADEVQVGFGRAGEAFWAFETQGAVPDIVTLGKPIGNGHPMAAVVTTPKIAASFANGMEYFNTFGGNPVSCAIGLAVLDVIQDERLQDNAREVGAWLQLQLQAMQADYELIGDVRGMGLFQGVEMVRDHATLEPAADEADTICQWLRHHGVLLSTDGPLHNVLKIKPPIVFSRTDAERFVEKLNQAFQYIGQR